MSGVGQTACSGHRDDSGFTLIELLATIALLSLLSLILLGSLRFGLKAWERGTTHSDRVDHIMLAQDFLRRVIEDAYPYFLRGDPTQGRIDFDGAADSLRFLASAPRALGDSGRSRFLLSLDRRDGRSDLVVTSNPELANDTSMSTRKILFADVQSVEFAYFGKGRSDRAAAWRDRWTGETVVPQLVRIQVQFRSSDTRLWPELVVTPRIAVDVGCVYDPLTKQCRGR